MSNKLNEVKKTTEEIVEDVKEDLSSAKETKIDWKKVGLAVGGSVLAITGISLGIYKYRQVIEAAAEVVPETVPAIANAVVEATPEVAEAAVEAVL